MLDLVFLILFIIIIFRSLRGYYSETLSDIAIVVGVLAGFLGIFINGIGNLASSNKMIFLNVIVIISAIGQRFAAQHFAKLYNDKIEQSRQKLEEDIELHSRKRDGSDYRIAEADFDNEEIRFGKGGLTPYNTGNSHGDENITINESKK
ncbi:MAG: hypothetical protein K2N06_01330 [Oscillospiraceae bacterium]|nr:hypothetical protein [Oscillospiraceae bacterium]